MGIHVIGIAQAAKSLVLLGDPQQLDHPQKGSHPDGAEVSALEHLVAGQGPSRLTVDCS